MLECTEVCMCFFVPINMYSNTDTEKLNIIKDNKNKCGVYRWINLETNKSYVGSSVNLGRRFSTYYSYEYLTKNSYTISRALLKYGYSSFRLDILEYCDKSDVFAREQHYLDLFQPEYNILKSAGSLLGFKHSVSTRERLSNFYTGRSISEQVKAKMSESQRGRTHSAEALANMSLAKLGRILTEEHKNNISVAAIGKTHSEESKFKISKTKGTAVVVHDTETGKTTDYFSVREVSRQFSVSNNTIARYIKSGLLFKDKYKISKQLV
uniref:GIY-YIG endonuclease n=1 Tax=Sclerotinia borealis TaxID=77105 RepID=A0A088CAE5_9HELO|nr:GIY-YIG endonuclease [Sclerotinia borealis]AHX82999.1 GIY-YIG endonuclease [Sclerotinia borealis]